MSTEDASESKVTYMDTIVESAPDGKTMAEGVNPYERTPGGDHVSTLGPTIVIRGELSADEDIIIQGKVEGCIKHKKSLTIDKQGIVEASTRASHIRVEGTLKGNMYGTKGVVVHESGNVVGDIYAPIVSLVEGAKFKGSIDMEADPAAIAESKEKSFRLIEEPGSSQYTNAGKDASGKKA